MRELIRNLIRNARRATWTDPAKRSTEPSVALPLNPSSSSVGEQLGADAVRLARIAAVMHMDQAAKLRARMRELQQNKADFAHTAAAGAEAQT